MKLSVLLLAAVAAAVTSPPFTHVQAGCAVTKERGCYRDNSSIDRILGPALPGRPAPMQAMTRAICAQICLDQKCALAGVEYGQQCFCGDRLNYPPVASSGCTTSCRGNSSETCGGTSAIDVYEFLCSGAPVPIPGPAPPPPSPTPNPPAHGGGCPGRSQCQCPCSPSSLCHSLPLGAARDFNATMKRVIAFHEGHAIYNGSANEWNLWDWDTVTTVVTGMVAGGDDPTGWRGHRCHNISQALLCQAHKRGVRVVGFTYWPWNTSPEDWEQLANATKRQLWVEGAVATAVRLGLDGYNVDIEGQMNASLRDALTNLTCELRAALTMAIPGASVSFDLAVDPGAYPPILRGYDYVGLARCLDVVTPMAYDMIGPVTEGTMMHHANAPLAGVLRGIEWYQKQGVALDKIDMLLPWYAYDYVCATLEPGLDCVPPTGFPHSNPGLGQVLDLHIAVGSPHVKFDNVSVSRYFDYVDGDNSSKYFGHRRRVTYDDAGTIGVKYAAVLATGLGGIGIWTADATHRDNADSTKDLAREMWAVVRNATR